MYKIIGTNGKSYGPATGEQVRQWIRQNRVEAQTHVLVTGSAEWTLVGLLPEFAGEFSADAIIGAPPTLPKRSRSMANAGLFCGVLSITLGCCCGGFPFNILGLVFSVIALIQIGENPQRYEGRDLAILGLVLSILGFLVLGGALLYR